MTDLRSEMRAHLDGLLEDLEDPMSMIDRLIDESSQVFRLDDVRDRRRLGPVPVAALAAALVFAFMVPLVLFGDDASGPTTTLPSVTSTTLVPAPSGSGDGWIAFAVDEPFPVAESGVDYDIWMVNLYDEPRRVIGTETDRIQQLCPAFSPDGRSLAYGRVEGDLTRAEDFQALSGAALVVADVSADGQVSDRMTVPLGDGVGAPCPVWSPDGSRVTFGLPRTSPVNPTKTAAGSEVWIVRLADGTATILPDLLATDLDWSPDGTVLAIASGHDHLDRGSNLGDGRIHLYDLASTETQVLDDTLGVYSLAWSPDGRYLAYDHSGPEDGSGRRPGEIRVLELATGDQTVVDSEYQANHGIGPVWSPDGKTLMYQRLICAGAAECSGERHQVVLVTPGDGSEPVSTVVIAPPRWAPDAEWGGLVYPFWVSWSPSGDYLIYRGFDDLLVALPVDRVTEPVVLFQGAISAYDGYGYTTFVPVQTWAATSTVSVQPDAEQQVEVFLQARLDGEGAEAYAFGANEDGSVPLLYATTGGLRYERFEFDEVPEEDPAIRVFRVRLFATDGFTMVEQYVQSSTERDVTDPDSRGTGLFVMNDPGTRENGQPVAEPREYLDGQVVFSADWRWGLTPAGWDAGGTLLTFIFEHDIEERLAFMAAPAMPVEPDCATALSEPELSIGPAPADSATLVEALRSVGTRGSHWGLAISNAGEVRIGGVEAFQMDVVLTDDPGYCGTAGDESGGAVLWGRSTESFGYGGSGDQLRLPAGYRMRLYLMDVPGVPGDILAVAVVASEERFDEVMSAAALIIDSLEFPSD